MFAHRTARNSQNASARGGTQGAVNGASSSSNASGNSNVNSFQRKHIRGDVVVGGFMALLQSPLLGFLLILALTIVVAVISGYYITLVIPFVILFYRWRLLLYEFFLAVHSVENSLGMWPWYHLVDTDLYLGALPLEPHFEQLTKKLRIGAVLSINQDFELAAVTMVGRPVSPAEWKSMDITHLQLSSPDWLPPSLELLDQGADFINTELSEGKKVYVHCKSGVGRSASLVVAYFIKYKRMDAVTAHHDLISKRPVIFKSYSSQMKKVKEYEQWLRKR
jgi:protein-tyrosine phosphatase